MQADTRVVQTSVLLINGPELDNGVHDPERSAAPDTGLPVRTSELDSPNPRSRAPDKIEASGGSPGMLSNTIRATAVDALQDFLRSKPSARLFLPGPSKPAMAHQSAPLRGIVNRLALILLYCWSSKYTRVSWVASVSIPSTSAGSTT